MRVAHHALPYRHYCNCNLPLLSDNSKTFSQNEAFTLVEPPSQHVLPTSCHWNVKEPSCTLVIMLTQKDLRMEPGFAP